MTSLLHVFGSTFPAFGASLLLGAMVVASYTFAVALAAGANGRPRTLQAARFGAYGTVALIGVAVLCLAYAFVSHDFRIRYVAHYSDRSMPLAVPAHRALGRAGRLAALVALPPQRLHRRVRAAGSGKRYLELQPYVIATLMAIVLFFCVLMAFAANPFATSVAGARADGEGLNPLLQNYWMVIHPPCLYTGFVGCSVPFAFAVAALVTGRLDHEWIVASRKWTLFAWMFLAIGNTLGMLWAYEELGWGGYWGVGPGRERGVHAVSHGERVRALGDDPGAARAAEGVERLPHLRSRSSSRSSARSSRARALIASVHSFAQSSIGDLLRRRSCSLLVVVRGDAHPLALAGAARPRRPSPRLRKAAVAAGWLVIGACVPGLCCHLAHCRCRSAGASTLIALVAGAAVFVGARARLPADDRGPRRARASARRSSRSSRASSRSC